MSEAAKEKVMVYVPADVRQALKLLAVSDRRPVSDLFVDAARAYLDARGQAVVEAPPRPAGGPDRTVSVLAGMLAKQGQAIAALGRKLDRKPRRTNGLEDQIGGIVVARAIGSVLAHLTAAATAGMDSRDLTLAIKQEGVTPTTVWDACSMLNDAGLIHKIDGRYYVGPRPAPTDPPSHRAVTPANRGGRRS